MGFKRLLDLIIAIPLLILISPLWLFIVIWIKVDSPGPAIFRQQRVGLKGEHFTIYKFRTMVPDADRVMKAKIEQLKRKANSTRMNSSSKKKMIPGLREVAAFCV